ncbi:hypothetical protein GEMRC1_008845 [Eukaryota sp. GEM-RC1]
MGGKGKVYFHEAYLTFAVELSKVGNCTLIGSSFSNIFHLKLSVEVTNFLIFPPNVIFNSVIQFYLSQDISNLFVTHGGQAISVNHGVNILNLIDSSTFITLHRFSQSMNVSFVTSLFDSKIVEVIEVNYPQSVLIDLNQFHYDFDISCSGNCQIALDFTQNSTLIISITGIKLGIIKLEVYASYHNSNFNFQIPILVENPPKFELVTPNVVTSFNNSFTVIRSFSHFELNSSFSIGNSIIDPSNVELIYSSDSIFVYRFELNLTYLPVFEGEYIQNLFWSQAGFKKHFISEIKFFNLEFSSNDHVSVFEHRDISVDFQGNLTSNLTCSIENQDFFGQVIDNYLVCKNVRIPTFQQHVCVDVYYDQFLLNSLEISGEAFLEEICVISFLQHPLINSSEIISNVDTNLIFDGSRCCSVDVSHCAELISKHETVLFLFQAQFDIHHVTITTNSSCEGIDSDLPFKLIVNNQTLSTSVSCKTIPSGYSFASMCEIDLVFPKTSEITLISLQDLYLLEIEFYGYKSNTCFKPFSFGKGVTSLGEVIDEDVHLRYNSQSFYSISEFKQVVVEKSTFWSSSFLTFPTELYSHHCYYSTVSYPTVFAASSASFVIFEAEVVELNPQNLNISIPIICVDPLNFIVHCDGMLSVMSSTFEFSDFQFFNNSLIFTFSNMIILGNHSFWISYNQSQFQWNGTIVQNFNQIFEISDFNTNSCDHQFTLDNACTILSISASLVTQNPFTNYSKNVMISDLSIVVDSSTTVMHILDRSRLEIIGPPLEPLLITLSYFSQSIALNLVSNDCDLPKLNSEQRCFCPKGMEFNFVGECIECALNSYSNLEFNSECRSCPFPRITLQKGSSDLDQCVCPLNTLDSIDSCLPCPHLAECGYGNLTGIQPGFRLNTDTWELDECAFWFNCQDNSCRSRHAYGDLCQYCTEDAVSTRVYCVGKEHRLVKILFLVIFVIVLFVTDRFSMVCLQSNVIARSLRFSILSLSLFRSNQILKQHLKYSNILNIFMIAIPVFSYKKISVTIVIFEYIASLFYLDKSMLLITLCVIEKV